MTGVLPRSLARTHPTLPGRWYEYRGWHVRVRYSSRLRGDVASVYPYGASPGGITVLGVYADPGLALAAAVDVIDMRGADPERLPARVCTPEDIDLARERRAGQW